MGLPPRAAWMAPYVDAGVFGPTEVHIVNTFARLVPTSSETELLGLAAAARGPRLGHVCVHLEDPAPAVGAEHTLEWPDADEWETTLASSALVSLGDSGSPVSGDGPDAISLDTGQPEPIRPLVLDGRLLYLQRYYRYEDRVAHTLRSRAAGPGQPDGVADSLLTEAIEPLFSDSDEQQESAAIQALTLPISVITGGPGTGKTHTIARVLAAAISSGAAEKIAVAAPTGKAATRVRESIGLAIEELSGLVEPEVEEQLRSIEPSTIHRLLGWLPGNKFRHGESNKLPFDLIVVDESSMVSLPLISKLLDAVSPDTRLVLVGDPDQLASVEAGTVLADIVAAKGAVPVAKLTTPHRIGRNRELAEVFSSVRKGDVETSLKLLGDCDLIEWLRPDESTSAEGQRQVEQKLVNQGVECVRLARRGDAEGALAVLLSSGVLAATRWGPGGLYDWSNRIERGVADMLRQEGDQPLSMGDPWYLGRPILVTRNDQRAAVSNGDVGIVINEGGSPMVALADPERRRIEPTRLDSVESWWAMTIHKSQGSQFEHVVVSLPSAESQILSRELLYTALTRTSSTLTLVASEASVRAAIATPISRASGLTNRLLGLDRLLADQAT